MSLAPEPTLNVPEHTAEVARAAFPRGNRYMQMRDELGTMYRNDQCADLYPHVGQPAEAPWRLALVTILQFAENLTDRQAADAVRGRIDWKYALVQLIMKNSANCLDVKGTCRYLFPSVNRETGRRSPWYVAASRPYALCCPPKSSRHWNSGNGRPPLPQDWPAGGR